MAGVAAAKHAPLFRQAAFVSGKTAARYFHCDHSWPAEFGQLADERYAASPIRYPKIRKKKAAGIAPRRPLRPAVSNSEVHDVADQEALRPMLLLKLAPFATPAAPVTDRPGEEVVAVLRLILPEILGEHREAGRHRVADAGVDARAPSAGSGRTADRALYPSTLRQRCPPSTGRPRILRRPGNPASARRPTAAAPTGRSSCRR